MKRIFTNAVLLLILFNSNSFAQAPNWRWASGTTLSGYEYGLSLYTGANGDIYTSGRLTGGTSTMGGASTNTNGTAAFIGRFHPAGNFVWLKSYPASAGSYIFEYMFAFYRDNATGTMYGTGTSQSSPAYSFWAQRWDSSGTRNLLITNNDGPQGSAIVADKWGNMYIGGDYGGSATFSGTTISASGGNNIFLLKYNSAGNLVWAKNVGDGGNNEAIKALAVDQDGNIYFSGRYSGTPSFVGTVLPAPLSGSTQNYFVTKFDSSGKPVWVTTVDNAGPLSNYENNADLKLDDCGNIYVTCSFKPGSNPVTQFGPLTLTSLGGSDMFVGKLSNSGKWQWVQSGGGTDDRDEGTGIALDKNFDVYVAGTFRSKTAYFGNIQITNAANGKDNVFVAKYANSTGDLQWVQSAGGTNGDSNSAGITVDSSKFVYFTGDFASGTTYGNNNLPGNDLVVASLDTLTDRQILVTPDASYCPGSNAQLPFVTKGGFNVNNVFTAQLSDSSGSFIGAQELGNTTSTGGNISIQIPNGTPSGSNYIIRVISSSPAYSSYDYCFKVAIGGSISVKANPADTTICSGSFVHLHASGGSTYSWSPGATLNDSTSANPYAAPTSPQIYTVTVSSGNCGGGTATVRVNVAATANVSVSPVNPTVCAGTGVQLTATGASSYTWAPADSLTCSTCSNPVANVQATTIYTVTGNGGACSNTFFDTVIIANTAKGGVITAVRDTICQGTPGNLSLSGNSGSKIQWQSSPDDASFTDALNDTLVNYKTNPLQQSTWYRAIVGSGSCSAISDSLQLIVPPALTANFDYTQQSGNQLNFNSDSSGGSIRSYHWDFGDGSTSEEKNPSHTYAKDSTYYVCLTLYDGSNCSYTFCRYSLVTGIPTVAAMGSWLVYPNPFGEQLIISSKQANSQIQSINVYDVLGRLVVNKNSVNTTNASIQIDASLLAKGMYYVMIRTADADYVQKVVKQ